MTGWKMLGSVFYLDGDSFRGRSRVEKSLERRLKFRRWIGQRAMMACAGDEKLRTDIPTRLAVLERLVSASDEAGLKVVIGRSSGARVASLFALRERAISAVVCFSYPFRNPSRPIEPERYAHLAHITTPTLILQGASDVYGGAGITEEYPLSDAVSVRLFDCGHDFRVPRNAWDGIANLVGEFCQRCAGPIEV